MRKGFAHILIIFCVIVFALFVFKFHQDLSNDAKVTLSETPDNPFLLSPAPEATVSAEIEQIKVNAVPSSWKTLVWRGYNFQIKYPDYWDVGIRNLGSQISFDVPTNIEPTDGLVKGKVTIEIMSSSPRINSLEEAVDLFLKYPQYIRKVKVGNLSAAEVHHKSCPGADNCIDVIFYRGDTIFDVHSNVSDEGTANLPTIYQMISTFASIK